MSSVSSLPFARIDYLDAVRAFALLLGIVFHASLSFLPVTVGWAVMDISTSMWVSAFVVVSHSFRMELFFLIAGFFAHLSFHGKGAGTFVQSRFVRLGIPFVIGWFILRPLIVSGWVMGGMAMRGDVDIRVGLVEGFKSLQTLPESLLVGTHLWFLYYLLMITMIVLVARGLVARLRPSMLAAMARGNDVAVRWLAHSRWGLPVLILPTIGLLWLMQGWGMDTPDKSLWPHWPVLALYGGFFLLGWGLHRNLDQLEPLTRLNWRRAVELAGATAGVLWAARVQGDPGNPHYDLYRLVFTAAYGVMMWLLVLGTIGVFRKVFARSRAWVRFVADSSYWMYLIHLPIVVWLQVAVSEWSLHWSLKLAFVSLVTIGIALLTYDLFVRSTFVGRILNGRRRERVLFARRQAPVSAPATA